MSTSTENSDYAVSTFPASWDLDYICAKAGIMSNFGQSRVGDTIRLTYRAHKYEVVQDVLDAYPVSYADDVLRARRWAAVKAIRDSFEEGYAPTPLGPADCDDRSKIKIVGLVSMATLAISAEQGAAMAQGRPFNPALVPFQEPYTMGDNSIVTLTAFDAIEVGKAVGYFISLLHQRARDLRLQIEAAANIDELMAIPIGEGWPNRDPA